MLISAGEIISKSIDLYKKNYQLFLKYASLFLIPTIGISIAALFLMPPYGEPGAGTGILYFLLFITASVLSLWFSFAFIRMLAARYQDTKAQGIKPDLDAASKLILPGILVSILTGIIVFAGFILLIIPGIIFSIWYAFSVYTLVLDNKRGMEALVTSKKLVQGRWWGVFWRLLAPGVVFGILTVVLQWIVLLPFAWVDPTSFTGALLASILSGVVGILVVPLTTAVPTILYIDLKKNKPATVPATK